MFVCVYIYKCVCVCVCTCVYVCCCNNDCSLAHIVRAPHHWQAFLNAAAALNEAGEHWDTDPSRVVSPPQDMEFIRFPIVDGLIADDAALKQLVADLAERVKKGRVLYVHCMGGHGYARVASVVPRRAGCEVTHGVTLSGEPAQCVASSWDPCTASPRTKP